MPSDIVKNSDGTITWTHSNGSVVYREDASGTSYHAQTPKAVVVALESARGSKSATRVFYGDPLTGRDWLEEHDCKGRIGRSMGPIKVPLVVPPGENGGSAILDHCVVRIQVLGRDVYKHPSYHQGLIESNPSDQPTHPYGVFVDGKAQANFKTPIAREKYLRDIQGLPRERQASKGLAM